MPGEGKHGNGMTFGRKAVMPGERKRGIGMTLGREATNSREVIQQGCL